MKKKFANSIHNSMAFFHPHFHHAEKKQASFFFHISPKWDVWKNVTNGSFLRFLGFYGPIPFRRRHPEIDRNFCGVHLFGGFGKGP